MIIKQTKIYKFRNIKGSSLSFEKKFNIFCGKNGQGKTNFLEALFFLGTLKSFRHARQKEMLQWDETAAHLECSIEDDEVEHSQSVTFEKSSRSLKIDEKSAGRVTDYCSSLSIIAFSPEEIAMINGSPEQRRRYLDRAVFSSDSGYLKTHHDYHRVLKQRNHLLKERRYTELEAWSYQLVENGIKLICERSRYVLDLMSFFGESYRKISGSDEVASLCYYNPILPMTIDTDELRRAFNQALTVTSAVERQRCSTIAGPHRDDLTFILNGRAIKEHGSQGQQKSFILALKIAEIESLTKKCEKSPVLLIDDMSAELDKRRVSHLIDFLSNTDIQVFITTTDSASIPVGADSSTIFTIENGQVV